MERDLEEKTKETERLKKELMEEKTKVTDGLKVAAYESQSKLKTAEMQTELYKSLLDIALNKLKVLEEHVSVGNGDIRRRVSHGNDVRRRSSTDNGDVTRRLSTDNGDAIRRRISRGRYILRVNSLDPTDMSVEDSVETSGNAQDQNLDGESVSSNDPSSSKRTSICSLELLGSETNLPSMSSLGSSTRDDDVFGGVDGPDGGAETYTTNSLPVRRRRAASMGGPSEASESSIRPRTATIGSPPPLERASTYNSIVSPSGFKTSIGSLVKASSESITGVKPSSRSARLRGSVESVMSKTGSVESETSFLEKPEEPRTRITTLREIKRKRSDSVKASSISPHEATLQKLHKYRSVGDLIKGITGRSSKEESTTAVAGSIEDLNNNNNNREKVAPPLIKSRTYDVDHMQPKLLKTLNRRTSYDVLPSNGEHKTTTLSREPSDVSTHSVNDVKLSNSSSTDDVAGMRTSGFVALRTRRNGMIADPAEFKDISKQLRRKQKGGGARDLTDLLKRLSRDNSDEMRDEEYKSHRRRSKNK